MADVFDIDSKFDEYLSDIGMRPADFGGAVTFTGNDPILHSLFRLGAVMAC